MVALTVTKEALGIVPLFQGVVVEGRFAGCLGIVPHCETPA